MSAPDLRIAADAESLCIAASEMPVSSVDAEKSRGGTLLSWDSIQALLAVAEMLVEFSAAALAMFAAYYVCFSMRLEMQPRFPIHEALAASVLMGTVAALLLRAEHAQFATGSPLQIHETEKAVRVSVQALLLLLLLHYFVNLSLSPLIFFVGVIATSLVLIVETRLFVAALRVLHSRGIGVERVAVYADSEAGPRIASFLLHSPRLHLLPVVLLDAGLPRTREYSSSAAFPRLANLPMQRGPLTAARLQSCRCELLVADAMCSAEELAGIERAANEAGCRLASFRASSSAHGHSREWLYAGNVLTGPGTRDNVPWFYPIAKRMADIALSLLLLLVLAPLLALIASLVCLDSSGPALFTQKRVGRNGAMFKIYKFRSMHTGVPRYEASPISSRDRRITRLGRWLRRSSLDELPQLFNVLTGSMSLVGPRPEMPFLVERHAAQHALRLQAKPGITGLWQLSPARFVPIHENPEYDHYYIRNQSCCLDAAILIHTLLSAVRGI